MKQKAERIHLSHGLSRGLSCKLSHGLTRGLNAFAVIVVGLSFFGNSTVHAGGRGGTSSSVNDFLFNQSQIETATVMNFAPKCDAKVKIHRIPRGQYQMTIRSDDAVDSTLNLNLKEELECIQVQETPAAYPFYAAFNSTACPAKGLIICNPVKMP